MVIGTVVLVPIVEETLYRGLIFGLLPKRILRYAVSVGAFCAIHVMGYIGYYEPLHLLLCFMQYIPAGLVLAYAYERSGSIFAPILIHMAINGIAMLFMR
jgi:membrane protease YdiL (CAAX protease family)